MRISDLSSDVCSSDLEDRLVAHMALGRQRLHIGAVDLDVIDIQRLQVGEGRRAGTEIVETDEMSVLAQLAHGIGGMYQIGDLGRFRDLEDHLLAQGRVDLEDFAQRRARKSVVWGKSVSVRVDLGGRRRIKKKKQNKQ